MNKPLPPKTPLPIDDTEDRMGSMEPLDFPDDENRGRIGDDRPLDDVMEEFPPRRLREAGLTGGSVDDHQPTDDDLSPETLIREDGARSAHERGHGLPADRDLSVVDEDEIGGGNGLDEEELARQDPLDSSRDRDPKAH
ncbi:serine kinase/phosphatase [Pseudomonas sp. RIT-PI-AD]|uniref:serine kinase/phosphatase n=1 Tax=Pseudomonas sp. RIT-PI-AD TaxID=3035294 RepID=UPI0021D80386|nr:serine kinase/phosphatase [Pseudomonas sp. RIT-PI-AD]